MCPEGEAEAIGHDLGRARASHAAIGRREGLTGIEADEVRHVVRGPRIEATFSNRTSTDSLAEIERAVILAIKPPQKPSSGIA